MTGSGTLVSSLLREGLLDEHHSAGPGRHRAPAGSGRPGRRRHPRSAGVRRRRRPAVRHRGRGPDADPDRLRPDPRRRQPARRRQLGLNPGRQLHRRRAAADRGCGRAAADPAHRSRPHVDPPPAPAGSGAPQPAPGSPAPCARLESSPLAPPTAHSPCSPASLALLWIAIATTRLIRQATARQPQPHRARCARRACGHAGPYRSAGGRLVGERDDAARRWRCAEELQRERLAVATASRSPAD
jgi:hypothetical protein